MNSERPTTNSPRDRPLLHAVDWAAQAGVTEEVMLGTRRRSRRRRQQRFAVGGAVGALAIGAAVWFSALTRPAASPAAAVLSAVVTAPVRQILPDGTLVELKDNAQISVNYSPATRRVTLQRGEAHFQVMKDAARPFVVAVDSVEVRAVGTSFSVQRSPARIEVLVTTGRVAVDRIAEISADHAPSSPQTIATLEAGNRTLVEVSPSPVTPVVEQVSETEIGQRLAWRVPRLEFTRTPLAEAIPLINRHSPVQLSLADAGLGSIRISGLLRVDNVGSLFRLLEAEHGIKAEHRNAMEVVLRPDR